MEKRSLFQVIFGKIKPRLKNLTKLKMLYGHDAIFTNVGDQVYQSKVAREVIDRIATHCGKLVPKHIRMGEHIYGDINYLLEVEPNPIMTKYDFLYKIISQLYADSNAFVYIAKDRSGFITGFYPVLALDQKLLEDESGNIYLKFKFINNQEYTVRYERLIHLRKFYNQNEIFRRQLVNFKDRH